MIKNLFVVLICLIFNVNAFAEKNYETKILFDDFFLYLDQGELSNCHELIQEIEHSEQLPLGTLDALRGALMLMEGNIEEGVLVIENTIDKLIAFGVPTEKIEIIKNLIPMGKLLINSEIYLSSSKEATIHLCKKQQSKGTCFSYWFGVAQVVLGVALVPVSGAASTALITSGASFVGNAVSASLDHNERQRELDHIHRNNPDPQATSIQKSRKAAALVAV